MAQGSARLRISSRGSGRLACDRPASWRLNDWGARHAH